jgi:hypothetical protein
MGIVGSATALLYLIGLLIYGLVVGFAGLAETLRSGGPPLR